LRGCPTADRGDRHRAEELCLKPAAGLDSNARHWTILITTQPGPWLITVEQHLAVDAHRALQRARRRPAGRQLFPRPTASARRQPRQVSVRTAISPSARSVKRAGTDRKFSTATASVAETARLLRSSRHREIAHLLRVLVARVVGASGRAHDALSEYGRKYGRLVIKSWANARARDLALGRLAAAA